MYAHLLCIHFRPYIANWQTFGWHNAASDWANTFYSQPVCLAYVYPIALLQYLTALLE